MGETSQDSGGVERKESEKQQHGERGEGGSRAVQLEKGIGVDCKDRLPVGLRRDDEKWAGLRGSRDTAGRVHWSRCTVVLCPKSPFKSVAQRLRCGEASALLVNLGLLSVQS